MDHSPVGTPRHIENTGNVSPLTEKNVAHWNDNQALGGPRTTSVSQLSGAGSEINLAWGSGQQGQDAVQNRSLPEINQFQGRNAEWQAARTEAQSTGRWIGGGFGAAIGAAIMVTAVVLFPPTALIAVVGVAGVVIGGMAIGAGLGAAAGHVAGGRWADRQARQRGEVPPGLKNLDAAPEQADRAARLLRGLHRAGVIFDEADRERLANISPASWSRLLEVGRAWPTARRMDVSESVLLCAAKVGEPEAFELLRELSGRLPNGDRDAQFAKLQLRHAARGPLNQNPAEARFDSVSARVDDARRRVIQELHMPRGGLPPA